VKALVAIHNQGLRAIVVALLLQTPGVGAVRLLRRVPTDQEQASWSFWDLVVVDASLVGWGGFNLLARLRAQLSPPPVIVVSPDLFAPKVALCLKLGAVAFVVASGLVEELPLAVQAARTGATYVSPAVY
jgi:DNA-binding NarL/FixJ family response regulator